MVGWKQGVNYALSGAMICARQLEGSSLAMHSDQYQLHERLIAEQRHSAWVSLQLESIEHKAKKNKIACIKAAAVGIITFATHAIVNHNHEVDAEIVSIREKIATLELNKAKLNPLGSEEVLANIAAEEGSKRHLSSCHTKLTLKRTLLWY